VRLANQLADVGAKKFDGRLNVPGPSGYTVRCTPWRNNRGLTPASTGFAYGNVWASVTRSVVTHPPFHTLESTDANRFTLKNDGDVFEHVAP
jgi:hypothetical protein